MKTTKLMIQCNSLLYKTTGIVNYLLKVYKDANILHLYLLIKQHDVCSGPPTRQGMPTSQSILLSKLKKVFHVLTFSCLAFCARAQRNVIIIIADDLGTDYCGFYENHKDTIAMPNIRKLLTRGIRFQNAWSNPLCSPTRAGIFTGRYSFRTGVGNTVGLEHPNTAIDTAEISIPRLLNSFASGKIATGHFGKWHLNLDTPTTNLLIPNKMGYDHYSGNFRALVYNYYSWKKVTNGVEKIVKNYATTETVNDAISWLKTTKAKSFFLWLAFNAPHVPYHVPPKGLYSDTTLTGTPTDITANPKKYFKASVEALDHEMGRLIDSLIAYQKWDSTDVIFIGDNGEEKNITQYNPKHAKETVFEESVNVPFIISGPSVVNPNRVSDALINTQDLFATILELFGDSTWHNQIPLNKPVDSKSILPIIKNTAINIRPWAFTEVFHNPHELRDAKAIRNRDYKLLDYFNGSQKFYHLATDTFEENDLLLGTLNTIEIINYNKLCVAMSNLVGTENYCDTTYALPVVEISASETKICAGTAVSFTAIANNVGTSPIYKWKKNGNNVGKNSLSFIDSSLVNGDSVYCKITTEKLEVTTSNVIKMIVNNNMPAKPSPISGENYNLCNSPTNFTYAVVADSNAITYNWGLPSNTTIINGQGTPSINVNYASIFNSGTMTVQALNYCGGSSLRIKNIYAKPQTPGNITGLNSVCAYQQNVSYSIPVVLGANFYKWELPAGSYIVSGQGSNTIFATFGNLAGTVSVFAKNSCANSLKSNLLVSINCRTSEETDDETYTNFKITNPFNDVILFTSALEIFRATVLINDLQGQEIMKWNDISVFKQEQQILTIPKQILPGIYTITFSNSSIKIVRKIIHL